MTTTATVSPAPPPHENCASSKLVSSANDSVLFRPFTDEVVAKYETPAVPFTYGRTGPRGAMSCGPTPSQAMLFVVVRSS